jgi:ATP-dependent Clp endopeptidase proteolytic subunit ClpP
VPFGGDCEFEDQAACERANQDRDDPAAYCAALRRRTEGHCMDSRDVTLQVPAGLTIERPRLRLARPLARQAKPWYRISAKAAEQDDDDQSTEPKVDGDTTIIDIYDEVGWFGTGAADFVRDLRQVDTPKIELHLNSPGGDVFDAVAIYTALRQHKAHVHVLVDSLAASAASFIAMAGDKVTAMANAMLMIHDPWGLVIGNAADMREMAGLLDKHGDNIASIYAAHAGGEIVTWRERMLAETWYLADEAYAAGLVDEVADADGRPISDAWDLSVFAHGPDGPNPFQRHPDADSIPPRVPVAASAAGTDPAAEPADAEKEEPDPDPVPVPVPQATTTRTTSTDRNGGRGHLGETASWYLPRPAGKETPPWMR